MTNRRRVNQKGTYKHDLKASYKPTLLKAGIYGLKQAGYLNQKISDPFC
jgi:hypothetical protein